MVTGTMIGVAYVYLSALVVIVGHLLMLCLNDAYLLSCWSGVGRLVLFTYSALKHNSLEWHLTIASLCMLGAVGQCCASVQFAHKYIGADVIGADMHC